MYDIDRNVFLMVTGVTFESDLGKRFRRIAIEALGQICNDLSKGRQSNTEVAHKIKGIALSFGADEISRICLKLAHYDAVVSNYNGIKVLTMISKVLINKIEL
ncbi:Hpt domain-containing protein [Vibrio chagasii]|uniref:Hpt domain-containing protein n=1 Tax=Vibrio chagasii TaxID=170679 RepID=UPI001EFC65F8|nr:Hpt domain-containing protein [Vibrio chagasii]MCG9604091.1 Hpt domain-containing protein [Vibrio chagasii]